MFDIDQQSGKPAVAFRLNASGSKRFGDITTENVGYQFAIVLDNKVVSAPIIRQPITGGNGIITGSFSVEEANDLAVLLRAGALPAPLTILEERTVGPGLGADSIRAGKIACVFAFRKSVCAASVLAEEILQFVLAGVLLRAEKYHVLQVVGKPFANTLQMHISTCATPTIG